MKRKLSLLFLVCVTFLGAQAQSVKIQENLWETDDSPNIIVRQGNTVYLAGRFDFVGPNTGCGIPFKLSTGKVVAGFPKVNGTVYSAMSDGKGGWFIGGSFDRIGGYAIPNLAHVTGDNRVDTAWNPQGADRTVHALDTLGNFLYVGGQQSGFGTSVAYRLGRIGRNTGIADTAWKPRLSGFSYHVVAIKASGNKVYFSGYFNQVGGVGRTNLAACDTGTARVSSWRASTNGNVTRIRVRDSLVYLAGDFNQVNGVARSGLAAVDTGTGLGLSTWQAAVGGNVHDFVLVGNKMYFSGSFGSVDTAQRNGFAAVTLDSAKVLPWAPVISSQRSTENVMAYAGGQIFLGGSFVGVGGQERLRIASVDTLTGQVTAWNPGLSNYPVVLAASDSAVFAGGIFTSADGVIRHGLAALNATTGEATAWDPQANSVSVTSSDNITSLVVHKEKVYVVGPFTQIGGQNRAGVAQLDTLTGLATTWDARLTAGVVNSIAVAGSKVYLAGKDLAQGNLVRGALASLDIDSGRFTSWDPMGLPGNRYSEVAQIVIQNGTLFARANPASFPNFPNGLLPAFDTITGAQNWTMSPQVGSRYLLASSSDRIYFYGNDNLQIGSSTKSGLAYVNWPGGQISPLSADIGVGVDVKSVAINGNRVYVAGTFTRFLGQTRQWLVAIDYDTDLLTTWQPRFQGFGGVSAVHAYGNMVYIGTWATHVEGQRRRGLVALSDTSYRPRVTSLQQTQTQSGYKALSVYPNPTHNEVHFVSPQGNQEITLTNALGQVVLTQPAVFGENTLSLSGLARGLYLLQVGDGRARIVLE